jgi:hypothetical protein
LLVHLMRQRVAARLKYQAISIDRARPIESLF